MADIDTRQITFTPAALMELVFQVAGAATAGLFARSGEVFPEGEVTQAVRRVVYDLTGIDTATVEGYAGTGGGPPDA